MAHQFNKYKEQGGAYHWDPKKAGPEYMAHVDNVVAWIEEDPVLDIGGGDGYICHRLREAGKEVLIVDNEPYAIELATEKGQPAIQGDIMQLPPSVLERRWGAVYLGDIIEHLDDPEAAVKALKRLTDVIYIATPPADPRKGFNSKFHTMEFTPGSLNMLMSKCGWAQTRVEVGNCRIFARYRLKRI